MTLRPGDRLGHFEILSALASGGMGDVYRARDPKLDREIAVKVLPDDIAADADRLARFRREARTLAALNHPNIVTVYSVEDEGDDIYMTMELVHGESLDRVVARTPVSRERFFGLAIPLVEAIDSAHRAGVTHRDLKPANVMVLEDGRIKVLDFGLARRATPTPTDGSDELTLPGMLIGTIPYLSPEHINGETADERSDIFSLGVLFYEIATGERPFRGGSSAAILAAILRDTPAPITAHRGDLPRALSVLIARCLEKDPEARVSSCGELLQALQKAEQSTLAAGRSIAVLPFADMSPEKDQGYFCEGIAEEILNVLSQIDGLDVASRLASFRFRGDAVEPEEVGRALNVDTILDGSLRKSGNRIRVVAHLVDVDTGYDLWSERFDRDLEDVFAIQDEIAEHIVRALEVALTPSAKRELKQGATSRTDAYDAYLQARHYLTRGDRPSMRRARELFSQAIRLDSHYAVAYAGLADCWSWLFLYGESGPSALEEADAISRRVTELAPDLAEAHTSRALVLSLLERDEESDAAFELAIRKNPNLFEAYYLYARATYARGSYEKAAGLFQQAHRVRSDDFMPVYLLGKAYRGLDLRSEAEAATQLALAMIQHQVDLNPEHTRARAVGSHCHVELGRIETGLSWADRFYASHTEESLLYYVACAYARADKSERALEILGNVIDAGWAHRRWLDVDTDLDSLRDHPAFAKLRDKLA